VAELRASDEASSLGAADLLAKAYSPFDPGAGMWRAGRAVLERIEELTRSRTDFAFETTLAGRGCVLLLRDVKKAGFQLHMNWLCSEFATVSRAAGITSRSGMSGGVLAARYAICSPFAGRCSIRFISSTIR
jgi:predicted ABC-type ATPase